MTTENIETLARQVITKVNDLLPQVTEILNGIADDRASFETAATGLNEQAGALGEALQALSQGDDRAEIATKLGEIETSLTQIVGDIGSQATDAVTHEATQGQLAGKLTEMADSVSALVE